MVAIIPRVPWPLVPPSQDWVVYSHIFLYLKYNSSRTISLLVHTGVPGGNANTPLWRIPIVSEYIWVTGQRIKQPKKYCKSGYIVHKICIMTSADLSSVHRQVNAKKLRGPMFHNKYFMERDHTVMDCLEEQLVVRNRLEYEKDCLAWHIILTVSMHPMAYWAMYVYSLPYSRKYWGELNLAVEPKIAIGKILAGLNLAVRYGIAICIYTSRKFWRILIWWL